VTRISKLAVVAMSSLLLASLGASLGCTSFAFPGRNIKGGAPDELKDPARMVKVSSGSYKMGETNGNNDEFPVHEIQLAGYSIDRTEVTNGDYSRCVKAGVCTKSAVADDPAWSGSNQPVVAITWYSAAKYCKWVGKRLPTEAEWEVAARGRKSSRYPWGNTFDKSKINSRHEDGVEKSAPVGRFSGDRSEFGVQDMGGNVSEWVADWYDGKYYPSSPKSNPKGPSSSTGMRSVRGGSWSDNDYRSRSSARLAMDPHSTKTSIGFRCAK
jgi:formylglycine-generating enzyme required for sulfatase activity